MMTRWILKMKLSRMPGLPSQSEIVQSLYGVEYSFCCGVVIALGSYIYLPSINAGL